MLRNSPTLLLSVLGLALAASTFACSGASSDNADLDTAQMAVQKKDGKPTGDGRTCSWGGVTVAPPVAPISPPSGGSIGGCASDEQGNTRCWSYPSEPEETPPPPPVAPAPSPEPDSYQLGAWFPSPDGCNRCTCTGIGIMCTVQVCPAPPPPPPSKECEIDGKPIAPGTSFSPDGCNTCSCGPDGQVACTEMACEPPPPSKGCEIDGKRIEPGTQFSDGCNTCSCGPDGQAVCTKRACEPTTPPTPKK